MPGRDGIAALVILAASAVLFALTFGLESNPLVPIGPAFYPRIVLGITIALSAVLLAADLRARRRPPHGEPAPAARFNYALVVAGFAVFIAYVIAMPYLGFRVATFAFVAGLRAVLDPPRGARTWAAVAVLAAVTTAATYFVFETYLDVLMPRGRWTGF